MMYAVIPRRYEDQLPWIFDLPIDSWRIERLEENGAVQCYVGLKGESFSEDQEIIIYEFEGQIFEVVEVLAEWISEFGHISGFN